MATADDDDDALAPAGGVRTAGAHTVGVAADADAVLLLRAPLV